MTSAPFDTQLAACAQRTEAFLIARLDGLTAAPRLTDAMRHGALGGGKRLRPFLVEASARLFGVEEREYLAAGAALEMVHCYSLVHDDLPDMDNDHLRRGKPTVWKAYDPALAILAGDALLTEAFRVLTDPQLIADPQTRSELVAALAVGSGPDGMVAGQVLDIEGETKRLDEDDIFKMQALKTGALIRTGVEMGAILGRADVETRAALVLYGVHAGLAFQIADDILDVTASSHALGKTVGKDVEQNKSTIVSLRGVDGAREILEHAVEQGIRALNGFGQDAEILRILIRHFAEREH